MTTNNKQHPRVIHDSLLPQHRPSACAKYLPQLNLYLQTSRVVAITIFSGAQTTYVARFRDAINAIEKYNWPTYTPTDIERISRLVVISTPEAVLLGTRQEIKAYRITPTDNVLPTPKQNEIEIISLDAIANICSLIQNCALVPQPLFYTLIHIPDSQLLALQTHFPNVVITIDQHNPNKRYVI